MRRVWLLLLAVMLPLQAAWAATHGYAHDVSIDAHAVVETVAHHEESATASTDQHADGKGHGCCDMAHSCHGSPSLVSALPSQPAVSAGHLLNASSTELRPMVLVSRHERPQWSPA
jgi:hypothetical protein